LSVADAVDGWTPAVALTIGGSDSAGRCGVEADLRTFAALRVHGCCALSVVTAQDTQRVRAAWPLPVEAVVAQVEAVVADLDVDATKVGMLGRAELIEALAALATAGALPRLVVDPVLVSGAGEPLFPPDVVGALRRRLLPLASVVTPNRDELALLTSLPPARTTASLVYAARALADQVSVPLVLASGGRLDGAESVDVLVEADSVTLLTGPRVPTVNVAGTGDSLSAAVAAGLAVGLAPGAAVTAAKEFVERALAGAARWRLGRGRGPIDHLGWGRAGADQAPDQDGVDRRGAD
jgi:hydroxymethylpyrimidine/phosphomethylpyrimidine kinase